MSNYIKYSRKVKEILKKGGRIFSFMENFRKYPELNLNSKELGSRHT